MVSAGAVIVAVPPAAHAAAQVDSAKRCLVEQADDVFEGKSAGSRGRQAAHQDR